MRLKPPSSGRLFVTTLVIPISGLGSYVCGKVLDRWGVFDNVANALGDYLKANVSPAGLLLACEIVAFIVLLGFLIWFVWRDAGSRAQLNQPVGASAPQPLIKLGDRAVLLGAPGEPLDMGEDAVAFFPDESGKLVPIPGGAFGTGAQTRGSGMATGYGARSEGEKDDTKGRK